MSVLDNTVRGLIESGIPGPLVFDLTYEDDLVLGPSLFLRLGNIYDKFWLMSGTPDLKEYCSSCVEQSLIAQLPPFEVSNDYFGFGGVFSSDPPIFEDFNEYRAVLYPPKSERKILNLHSQAITATLAVIFAYSELYPSQPWNDSPQQLFFARSGTKIGGGGCYLSPVLSNQAVQFVASNPYQLSEDVLTAMMRTWSALNGGKAAKHSDGFRAECNANRFNLSVPDGSGTNLSLPVSESGDKRSWRLTSHNVDSPIMQLEFLAGLGSIFTAIREQEIERGEI